MRIDNNTRQVIRNKVTEIFGDQADVLLFGSRLQDDLRGGDLDLLIRLPIDTEDRLRKELKLNAELLLALGDQKIDILTKYPGQNLQAVHKQALQTGRLL